METATSSRARVWGAALTLVLATAGCGASVRAGRPFGWLAPGAAPARWPVATIPGGAALAYPPDWRRARGDRGTATAVRLDGRGRLIGYLNLTPRQGRESVAHWGQFRVTHNAQEGDRHVRTLAAEGGLRFRSGRGACVKDAYTTTTGADYVELACLVSDSVVVGAAPPRVWRALSPTIERAISAFRG